MADSKQPTFRLDIRTVTDLSGLEQLRPQWNELLTASLRPTVFAAWEWQYLCAKHMAGGNDIVVLVVYDNDILVAVLPLHRERTRAGGLVSTDVLACLGGDITDYNVLLAREQYLSAVIPALAEHLRRIGSALDFRNVLPGTPLHLLEQYLAENGFAMVPYERKTALYTQLPRDYDTFIDSLKPKFRRNLRQNQNYIDRVGGYSYEAAGPTERFLTDLIRLHTSRWIIRGQSGALAHEAIRSFHTELQNMSDIPFAIRYYLIRHGQNTAALLYGFVFHNTYYAYLSGFDMEHYRISPGNMVFNYAIHALIDDGATGFDMLRGDMHYKQSWATGSMEMRDAILFPPSFSGRMAAVTMKAIMGAKRLIPKSVKRGLKSTIGGPASSVDKSAEDKDIE
jgi:CelD/BcsL family acetyltransferase involved in cellulose biosynthesis